MIDGLILAILVGAASSIATALAGGLIARRWGLPGLAREVEGQQSALIAALRGRIETLEQRVSELQDCADTLRETEGRLERAQARLLRFYETYGEDLPRRRRTP